MPRPLLYVAILVIVVVWLQRVARARASRAPRAAHEIGMPKHLVCGACGRQYDPSTSGWICPECHK